MACCHTSFKDSWIDPSHTAPIHWKGAFLDSPNQDNDLRALQMNGANTLAKSKDTKARKQGFVPSLAPNQKHCGLRSCSDADYGNIELWPATLCLSAMRARNTWHLKWMQWLGFIYDRPAFEAKLLHWSWPAKTDMAVLDNMWGVIDQRSNSNHRYVIHVCMTL